MSTKKNTNHQPTNANELRYACTNWDNPEVRVKNHGKEIIRKVKTRGTVSVTTGKLNFVIEKLRQGYDVTLDGVLLLKPMMKPDLSGMYVSARTAHALYDCLRDKVATVIHRGREIDAAEQGELIGKKKDYQAKHAYVQVTPDLNVTCPKCGYEFRVGRKIGD